MLDDLFVRSLIAAIGVALAAAPLGCFVLWRRMAYFGDATAHAGILGVALAIGFSVSVFSGVLAIAVLMGVGVWALADRQVNHRRHRGRAEPGRCRRPQPDWPPWMRGRNPSRLQRRALP